MVCFNLRQTLTEGLEKEQQIPTHVWIMKIYICIYYILGQALTDGLQKKQLDKNMEKFQYKLGSWRFMIITPWITFMNDIFKHLKKILFGGQSSPIG